MYKKQQQQLVNNLQTNTSVGLRNILNNKKKVQF